MCWESMPPPQKTILSPKRRLRSAGSMPRAEIWTGLRMSTPLSIRSGMYSTQPPQVWYQILAGVSYLMCWTRAFWRGLTTRR